VAKFELRSRNWLALIALVIFCLPAKLQALPQTKNLVTTNPTKLEFGNVQVGNTANLYETITNVGHVNINASSATITGPGFSYSGLSFPLLLAPGHSYTFTATFAPTSAGSATGFVTIYSDKGTLSIPLTGTGIAGGILSVSPSSLSFGSVNVGSNSQLGATLLATGGAVTVTAANINNSEFSLSGLSFPLTLQAGQTAPFTITFAPQQSGLTSGTLTFANSANAPLVVSLTGTGNNPPPPPSVSLSWDGGGSPVSGYNVFRGTVSGGPYAQLNGSLVPTTYYDDTTVSAGMTYYYVTTAVNSAGQQSSYSNQVMAVIP
jgi:hypothetical protein